MLEGLPAGIAEGVSRIAPPTTDSSLSWIKLLRRLEGVNTGEAFSRSAALSFAFASEPIVASR